MHACMFVGNNIHNVTIEANTTKKCTMLPLNDDIYQTSRSVNFSLSTNQERVNIGAPSSINVDVIDNDGRSININRLIMY